MAQVFRAFQKKITATSTPAEVRAWVEGLDYNFSAYGENFERAKINGGRLLSITRQSLYALGIIRADHQDILLKAVNNIRTKRKVEEPAMEGEDQNDKKMPTRYGKESELLEHAIDCVLVTISERRRARSLHGINEQPPHTILTATLELINIVKMILNILERPPYDCMSEFSSLKSHLIKHITLLKYFSEQSDLNHEMESDMIDVCKGVTKICHYIISLPPDIPRLETQRAASITPEERPSRVKVPIVVKPEAKSFTMDHGPDSIPPTQQPMPILITSSASKPKSLFQDVPHTKKRVLDRFEYVSPERLSTPSSEETVMLKHDEGNKSKTEVSDKKGSVTSIRSLNYKSLQDLTIIESDAPLADSGSERCMIDSDSDRGIGSDSDLEHSKGSDSLIWAMDSDSEKCPRDSTSTKPHLGSENYQVSSSSVGDFTEPEQHLVRVEQCQVDTDSLKHWMDSGSEKAFVDSDSEKYLIDSDSERLGIDSDSEKSPMASASVKRILKAEKRQMASDSIKRLIESEKKLTDTEKLWMLSTSEKYVMDSDTEKDRMDSKSTSKLQLVGEEKCPKTRSKRYLMDSDSEPCEMDSDNERTELAIAAVKCFVDPKALHSSTLAEGFWMDSGPERRTLDFDFESPEKDSGSVKHMKKAESCQSSSELERMWMGKKSESEGSWIDSGREQLDFGYSRCWKSSRRYQYRSSRLQDDAQKYQDNFESHQGDSKSKKHKTRSENEKHQSKFESKRYLMEMEKDKFHIQFESESRQDREGLLTDYGSEKKHRIEGDNEQHHRESENEAHRLGARKKANRPKGFWRPIFPPPPHSKEKKTEEKPSVQQTDNRVSRIQLVRYLSDDKTVRFKEVAPTISDNQASQQKLEKHSHNLSLDSNTFSEGRYYRKASRKISVYKSYCEDSKYSHSFQNTENSVRLQSAEGYSPDVSAPICSPTSLSSKSVVRRKTSLVTGTKRCYRCFTDISNSPSHRCTTNSDDDSDHDCPIHLQDPLDYKSSMSSRSFQYYSSSQKSPAFQSLGRKHPTSIRCPLHQEDYKYSLSSTSYIHCGICSTLQNLLGSIDCTFPMNSQSTTSPHNIPGSDSIINTSNVTGFESGDKFNRTVKPPNESKTDNETKLVSAGNLKDKDKAKDKPFSKDETDQKAENMSENETDTEEETDPEDEETDPEDEDKDKKDPKDKSDPDDTDPKDSNSEDDNDNNGSDPASDAGPESGADSNSNGDPNNETDSNSEPDSNVDDATNNDADSKYSSDPGEDMHTNNLDNAFGLTSDIDQDNTSDSDNDTRPNYISEAKNNTWMVYISGSNYDTDPNNSTEPGNNICSNIGPGSQKIRSTCKRLGPSNNYLGPNNKDPDFVYDARPSNSTNQNNVTNPYSDADPNYDIRTTCSNGHDYAYAATLNYDSDLAYVPEFTHTVRSSFLINSDYTERNSDVARFSSASSTINATDPSNITSCNGTINPRYNCASETNHVPKFTHFLDSNNVINHNSNEINTENSNYTSTRNYLSGPELEICSDFSVPNITYGNMPNFTSGNNCTSTPDNLTTSRFYDPSEFDINYSIFDNPESDAHLQNSAGSMGFDTLKHVTGSKDFLDAKESGLLSDFSRIQNKIGIKDPTSLKSHCSPNTLLPNFDIIVEAEPPDIVKFAISSGAVNKFFELLDNGNAALRAEGAMGEATRRMTEGDAWGPERGLSVRPKMDRALSTARGHAEIPAARHAMSPPRALSASPARDPAVITAIAHAERLSRRQVTSPVKDYFMRPAGAPLGNPAVYHSASPSSAQAMIPARERAEKQAKGHRRERAMTRSPIRGRAVSPMREYTEKRARGRTTSPAKKYMERKARRHTVSPSRRHNMIPAQGYPMGPARRPPVKPKAEIVLGAAMELVVKPAEGYVDGTSGTTQSSSDEDENNSGFSILTDTKADGFIYLPEFRVGLAPQCRRSHAFQATHARIKNFYFAAECSDEMNYWVGKMLQLACGSSFGDAEANAEYRRIGAMVYTNCVLSLKRDFPVIWCNNCHEATTIVSVNPNFQYRRAQNVSDEFIYFRPIDAEIREQARRQKQQTTTMTPYQYAREGIHQRDLGVISQVAMITTPPLTNELESIALIRPKTSGLLRLEKMPVIFLGFSESQRLDVTGIVSPQERGKGTAILVAGVPGKDIDDTEIPALKFTGFIHLEALINKSSPSSEYSGPGTPRNLWLESPENAESPGSDDLEVARSMYPFRERSIFRRSWAELLEAPLNSEGLHILQTIPTEENRETGYLPLAGEADSQLATPPRDPYQNALQGPFPLLPQQPTLQKQQQRSHSVPRYNDGRSRKLNEYEFAFNPEETPFEFPSEHALRTEGNAKGRNRIEESWGSTIYPGSAEHPPIKPNFEYTSTIWRKTGINRDNAGLPKSNFNIPKNDVSGIPMVNVGISTDDPEVYRGHGIVPPGSGIGIPMGNVESFHHNVGSARRVVSSPLTELSKIGEHQL